MMIIVYYLYCNERVGKENQTKKITREKKIEESIHQTTNKNDVLKR